MTPATPTKHVLIDLDGVVWLDRRPIAGSAEAVRQLRSAGCQVLFVTNNSVSPIADQEAALAAIDIPAVGNVVTSAQAAASLLQPSDVVAVFGGAGVVEAVEARGATIAFEGAVVDAVVVGLDRAFDYDKMQAANRAIRAGARFIATNDDATFPTPDGPVPGAGTMVAAIAVASEQAPLIAGKPHRPMAELVAVRCGREFTPAATVMIGDRPSTDGRFAVQLGCRFGLVRSGVTRPNETVAERVDLDTADLAEMVGRLVRT